MTAHKISTEHSHIPARSVRPMSISQEDCGEFRDFARVGINFDSAHVSQMADAFAMDDLTAPLLPSGISTPVQFLQHFLPGFVHVVTQPRTIDNLVGITVVGSPEDEEIVQPTLEHVGKAALYGDLTNIPLSGVGNGYERYTIVRTEMGLRVGWLEAKRASRAGIDVAKEKRVAAALALEILRNRIGFFGFNNGANRTYGFLNAPGLPAYVAVVGGVWSGKTFLQITADIRAGMAGLQARSNGLIDTRTAPITVAMSQVLTPFLTVTSDFGISVEDWFKRTYPNARIESSVDLNGANGGANVINYYADSIPDSGTDDGRVFGQMVPSKFFTIGTEVGAKHYTEDFGSATAGVILKRPYGIYRQTGA